MTKKYEFDWHIPVPQILMDGCVCDRWTEVKSDNTVEVNCMFKVDETGFWIYWKSEGNEGNAIDLCTVSDIRFAPGAQDSKLNSKLATKNGNDYVAKQLTICTNENYIDIEYMNMIFPDVETAKVRMKLTIIFSIRTEQLNFFF
jgi:phosphatidylinositol phospholipase C, beta